MANDQYSVATSETLYGVATLAVAGYGNITKTSTTLTIWDSSTGRLSVTLDQSWGSTIDQEHTILYNFDLVDYVTNNTSVPIGEVKGITVTVAEGVCLIGAPAVDKAAFYSGPELANADLVINVNYGAWIFGHGGSREDIIDGGTAIEVNAYQKSCVINNYSGGWISGGGGAGEGRATEGWRNSGGGAPYGAGFNHGLAASLLLGGKANSSFGNDGGNVGVDGGGSANGKAGAHIVGNYSWGVTGGRVGPA